MRQIYNRAFTVVSSTRDSGYVFADRIMPGYVLHVLSASAYSPARDASDNAVIGIRSGGEDIIITAQAPLAAQDAIDAPHDFLAGEHDQVFAYFADAENGDSIGIHLSGELIPLDEWEKMRGR